MGYTLNISDNTLIAQPTDEQIRQAIVGLDIQQDTSFAILFPTNEPDTYIQTSGDTRNGFDLEYQVGDTDNHFRALSQLDAEQTIAAFIAYRDSNDGWHTKHQWEQILL